MYCNFLLRINMKLSEATAIYDELEIKVKQGRITAQTMARACKALIELNKIQTMPPPFAHYRQQLSFSWARGAHNLEMSLANSWQAGLQINFRYAKYYSCWFDDGEPITGGIIEKLKFFC